MEVSAPSRARLERLMEVCSVGLVERESEVRSVFLAALAGEHCLLIGPPGTAKSEVARRLRHAFADGAFFERLLTRFSVPEELFGPLSIKRLEADEYHRLTEGYLPTATVAFLDEIFKANSAILNSLLTLLNERSFDNGVERVSVPLVSVIGASNELPEGTELEALHDRFLIRRMVAPVSPAGFDALLDTGDEWAPPTAELLGRGELRALRERARRVSMPAGVRSFLGALRERLAETSTFRVSDRRWRKLGQLLRVAVAAEERDEVALADCGVVLWCLWSTEEELRELPALVAATLRTQVADEIARLGEVAETLAVKVAEEAAAEEQASDDEGRLLWRGEDGEPTIQRPHRAAKSTTGDPLYVAPREMKKVGGRVAYTFAELWEHHYSASPDGYHRLEVWTANPAHEHREDVEQTPYLVPKRYAAQHLASRRDQLRALLSALTEHRAALGDREASPGLWHLPRLGDAGPLDECRQRVEAAIPRLTEALATVETMEAREP
ncbi:MAG: hypothetical protein CMN30_03905 [Sandaracinus sp.]|nr:hypothetical protein [Sandaracinus sp.]